MPIFRASSKVIFFAHVPKCAGSAVERYLRRRFGAVALLDQSFLKHPAGSSWTRTSPQHVTAEALSRLFPPSFFDASFTVVRNPVERMIAEYHHLRDHERQIPADLDFSDWLRGVPTILARDRSSHDNHLRPMYEFLPRGTTYFRLEDGLSRVVAYLDRLVGDRNGPRRIQPDFVRSPNSPRAQANSEDRALIAQIYRRDFELFGYPLPARGIGPSPPSSTARQYQMQAGSWHRASAVQEAMWLSPYAATEPAGDNLLWVIRFDGLNDPARISFAVNILLERHSVLRAIFHWRDGGLWWMARSHERKELTVEEPTIDRTAFGMEPYDLEQGPLFRFRLLRSGNTSYELLCGFHHLVIDGTSWPLFVRELARLLVGDDLTPTTIDYSDHVAWQHNWLHSSDAEPSRDFWRGKLKSLPTTAHLPALGGSGVAASRRGLAEFILSDQISALIRQSSARFKVSPFRIVLTVFAALMSRSTRREDVVVATTLTGRKRATITEGRQGPFINTGLISGRMSDITSLADLLPQIDAQLREMAEHQEYPLLTALRESQAGVETGHPALSCALMTRMPDPVLIKAGSLTVTEIRHFLPVNERELVVRFQAVGSGFRMGWGYAPRLLDQEGTQRLQAQFELLLKGALEDPHKPFSHLSIISEAERHSLLHDWNATDVDFPELAPVHFMVEAQVERTPEDVAVIDPERTWTYREIDCAANRIAALLKQHGVQPGHFVMLQMNASAAMIAAELAVMKCGAAFVPAAPEWPEARTAAVCARLGHQTLILTEAPGPGRLPITPLMGENGDPGSPGASVSLDDPIYCIFTSGSTGRPKGAVNCHRGIANNLLTKSHLYGSAAGDTVQVSARTTVDTHVWQIFWPLISGGKVVVASQHEMVSPTSLCSMVSRQSVTVGHFVPSILSEIVTHIRQCGARELSSLRLLLVGGEAMRAPDVYYLRQALPSCRIVNTYGPTETSIATFFFEVPEGYMDPVPIGRPIPNTRAFILEGTQLTPPGMVGELCLGGVCMGLGYLDDPVETAKSFIATPFPDVDCAKLYRTGDLARLRSDGTVECLGRIDNQIKIRGQRIDPGEVEAAMRRHTHVSSVVVYADGKDNETRLAAAFTSPPGCEAPDAASLKRFLRRDLPIHLVPSVFRHLDAMPLLPGGKIDRSAVASAAGRVLVSRRTLDPPQGGVEEKLASLWCEVLGSPEIGRQDDFFEDLGGDSLQAMRLISLIEDRFQVKAELRWIFEASELRKMAAPIATACGAKPSDALELQRQHVATWSGWKHHSSGLLFAQNPEAQASPLFWCFQGAREFMQMARHLGPDQPLVGMRSAHLMKELGGQAIEALAAAYAEEICLCQPSGPILIGGNCQGAVVAQAVAERVSKAGREVSMLLLLEATSFSTYRGPVRVLFGRDSHLNPFNSGEDPTSSLAKAYPNGYQVVFVPGAHGEFFEVGKVGELTKAIRELLPHTGFARYRLEMKIHA